MRDTNGVKVLHIKINHVPRCDKKRILTSRPANTLQSCGAWYIEPSNM